MIFGHVHAVMPYSHSLLGTLAQAVLLGAAAGRYADSRRIGLAVGIAVVSHYLLDALSHMSDMPVIGFGVQNFLNATLIVGTGAVQSNYGGNFIHKYTSPF